MIIGVPKETKNEEHRVAAVPSTVKQFTDAGHKVLVEKNAGAGLGFSDDMYMSAGAEIIDSTEELWTRSEMIYKVKEPAHSDYKYFREDLIIFCFLHIANDEDLLNACLEKKVVGIGYETVEENGKLPLLKPMSEIGGCMSVIEGANLLKKSSGGAGKLLLGMPGVPPGHVTVLGTGTAGRGAIRTAVGLGARVTAVARNEQSLSELQDIYGSRLETLFSNSYNISKVLPYTDLLIGTVLIKGHKTPKLVSEDMVKMMKKGSVIVDISVDQGGCIETIDRFTSHSNPTYEKFGVVHYAVPNIPGNVPVTATITLSHATTKYCLEIADKGWINAAKENPAIYKGINTARGYITYEAVADSFNREYKPLNEVY